MGLGPIAYPPLIEFLLSRYGSTECALVVAALGSLMLLAALLLQPVERHLKQAVEDQEMMPIGMSATQIGMPTAKSFISIGRYDSFIWPESSRYVLAADEEGERVLRKPSQLALDHDIDAASIYGYDQLAPIRCTAKCMPDQSTISRNFSRRTLCLSTAYVVPPKRAITSPTALAHSESHATIHSGQLAAPAPAPVTAKTQRRWFESGSLASIHLGSSAEIFREPATMSNEASKRRKSSIFLPGRRQSWIVQMFKKSVLPSSPEKSENDTADDCDDDPKRDVQPLARDTAVVTVSNETQPLADQTPPAADNVKQLSCCQSFGQWAHRFFDLDLFRDKVYVKIMLGLSLAFFAEINFNVLLPFILNDLQYTSAETAVILSVIASADLLSRFVSPFVGDHFLWSVHSVHLVSLIMLIITRTGDELSLFQMLSNGS